MRWNRDDARNAFISFWMGIGFGCFIIGGLLGIDSIIYLGYILLYSTMIFALDLF